MNRCRVRPVVDPVRTRSFYLILALIWLDLTLTTVGATTGLGEEANPLFEPFFEAGVVGIVAGASIYLGILVLWFTTVTPWLRAITAGYLVSIHTFGALSWIRMIWEPAETLFSVFPLIVVPPFIAVSVTIWTYIDLRSCPEIKYLRSIPDR